jgi:capsular polysaccharide biosynthesis protein
VEIRDYVRILTRRWWVILLACVVAAGVAYGYSKTRPQVYRASVTLLAQPNRADYGLSLFLQNRINSYKQEVVAPALAQEVIDRAKLDLDAGSLLAGVRVATDSSASTILITVDDQASGEAQVIANTLADVFAEKVAADNLSLAASDLRVDVVKVGSAGAGQAVGANTKTNVLAGAIMGLLLGGLLAFGLEYLDDTLKTAEDVERFVGLPILGLIPADRRSQADSGASGSGRPVVSMAASSAEKK